MTDFPIPTGPIHDAPTGYRPATDNETTLRDALTAAGVELGTYDEQLITWLANWEWATVAPIASWITRAHAHRPAA
jgi:hypothetical protein